MQRILRPGLANFAQTDTCDTMRNKNTNSTLFLEELLGILSAFWPFVMNTCLAGLPQIAEYYSAQPAAVQLSLATCTVGLAIGQFVFGAVGGIFSPLVGIGSIAVTTSVLFIAVTVLGCLSCTGAAKVYITEK